MFKTKYRARCREWHPHAVSCFAYIDKQTWYGLWKQIGYVLVLVDTDRDINNFLNKAIKQYKEKIVTKEFTL